MTQVPRTMDAIRSAAFRFSIFRGAYRVAPAAAYLRPLMLISLLLGAPGPALACSCMHISNSDPKLLDQIMRDAQTVVHGRVVSLKTPHLASVEVIESFKPQTLASEIELRTLSDPTSSCYIEFTVGEEALYVVYKSGMIGLCSRLRPRAELINAFRAAGARSYAQPSVPMTRQ